MEYYLIFFNYNNFLSELKPTNMKDVGVKHLIHMIWL